MTTQKQPEQGGVASLRGKPQSKVSGIPAANDDQLQTRTQRRAAPEWMAEKLYGVRQIVVEGLFGKRHWAMKWVISLCEADPRFFLHLAEQPPGYVHFVCLVRVALLERAADDKNAAEYARTIRTTSKKKLLNDLFPSCSTGVINVLPKLPVKPLTLKDYRQLMRALQDDKTRKRLLHAKKICKGDIHLADLPQRLPREFRSGEVMHCIKNTMDYELFCMLVETAKLIGFQITGREINEINAISRKTGKMKNLLEWFMRKFSELPFPPPPWDGNESIKPVRSGEELKAAADRFQNCLGSRGYRAEVTLRKSYFYVCERTPAVIKLRSVVVFGWMIDEINGLENRDVTRDQHNEIKQAFLGAGIFSQEKQDIFRRIESPRMYEFLDW